MAVGVHLRADRLHKVACKTVARGCINVQNAETRIETECCSGKASLRLKHGVKVIKNCIRRICSEPR